MIDLQTIIRRLHCFRTHQRFAIDALPMIESKAGQRLVRWLQYYHRSYLAGAIDPDVRFRDFHNHVLHVRQGFWGGAPRVASQWYQRLQKYLRAERFRDAAHAAGVLTHYITDVTQPLHTISSEPEALIHRPLERSVERSYDLIHAKWQQERIVARIQLSDCSGWLGSLMMHAAHRSSSYCEDLVGRYRFQEGVKDPISGFDERSLTLLAELFAIAVTSVAVVLDRAAVEAESYTGYPLPEIQPNWTLAGSILRSPVSLWKQQRRRRSENRCVRELAREYFRTGKLTEWLPPEVDIKQRVIKIYQSERRQKSPHRAAA